MNSAVSPGYLQKVLKLVLESLRDVAMRIIAEGCQLNELKPIRHAAHNNASSIKHACAMPWHLPSVLRCSLCVCAVISCILAGTTELRFSTLLCTERVTVEWRCRLVSGRYLLRIGKDACFLGDFHGYPQSLKVYAGLVRVLGHR